MDTLNEDTEEGVTNFDGRKKWLCEICSRSFTFLSRFKAHKQRHEPPGGFVCQICGSPFCSEVERERHKKEAHEIIKCSLCAELFNSPEEYQTHVFQVHGGIDQELFECPKCQKKYKNAATYHIHQQTSCGTLRNFACTVCGCTYPTAGALKTHMQLHEARKKHVCGECGKEFTFKGQLVRHERQHSGAKPYKCEVCSKTFSYRESLVTHSTLHTGIKPYMCFCCDAKFSCVGNLSKHRRRRPATCGLPEYDHLGKVAPMASRKEGTLTGSTVNVTAKNRIFLEEPKLDQETFETEICEEELSEDEDEPAPQADSSAVYRIVRKTNEIFEIQPLSESEDDAEALCTIVVEKAEPFQCPECPRSFVFKKRYEKHLSDFHKMHLVDVKQLTATAGIPQHAYECNYCTESFATMLQYMEHSELHGPDGLKVFKCPSNCKLFFASAEEVDEHVLTAHRDTNICVPCNKVYSSRQSLRAHEKYAHSGRRSEPKRKLQCDKCEREFGSRTALVDHEMSNCGASPAYECSECHKCFQTHGSLRVHALVHTGELPFRCDHCGKGFRTQGQNRIHQRSHTGEKPFQCESCDKSFAYRQSLITHMTTHTGQKRYKCFYCDQNFSCISNLQSHRAARATTCGAVDIHTKAVGVHMGVQKGQFVIKEAK